MAHAQVIRLATAVQAHTRTSTRPARSEPLIRFGWLVFAGVLVSLAFAGVTPYLDQIITACDAEPCLSSQPRTSELRAITAAGYTLSEGDAHVQAVTTLLIAGFAILTAGFGIWRRPANPAVLALGILLPVLAVGELLLALGREQPAFEPVADAARLVHLLALAALLVLLPDGRLPSTALIWPLSGTAVLATTAVLFPADIIWPALYSLGVAGLAALNLTMRYRTHPAAEQRQHLIWATTGLALLGGAQMVGRPLRILPLPGPPLDSVASFGWLLISAIGMVLLVSGIACLAIALLHEELIEIEVVINRALVYGLMTVIVVGAYVGLVGYLSLIFQGSNNLWFSLAATGVIAVFFQRIRELVQGMVNQLLYGRRDEPYEVLSRLGRRLEHSLPPDAVLNSIVQAVAADLKLPYVAITLRRQDGTSVIRASAGSPGHRTATFALLYQGETVGDLLVAPRPGEADLGQADRRLLADLARQAGIAVRAARLTEDLQRSRQQLVTAREEERRRIRRDLHDGLGPALATMTLHSDAAHDLLQDDPDEARKILRELTRQSQTTMEDVRRLIHALRPPVLDDLGLAAAFRALAASFGNTRTVITIDVPEPVPPLPAAIEVAVYRITQEALTNTIRHAGAQTCSVSLCWKTAIRLRINDDGRGLPPARSSGVGLSSIRERAEELGGAFEIESSPGQGVTIFVEIPYLQGECDGADPHSDRG